MSETSLLMSSSELTFPNDLFLNQHPCRTLEILIGNAFENGGNKAVLDELNDYICDLRKKGYVIHIETHHKTLSGFKYQKFHVQDSTESTLAENNVLRTCVSVEGYLILVQVITINQRFISDLHQAIEF